MFDKLLKAFKAKKQVVVQQITLAIGGLALISWGIGLIYEPAGVIAGGVSLLLLEWRLSDDE